MLKSEHIGRLQNDIASYPFSQVRKEREKNATYPKKRPKLVKQVCPSSRNNMLIKTLSIYLRAFAELAKECKETFNYRVISSL